MSTSVKNLSAWQNSVLFESICQLLINRFGSVPQKGILAGQAVASACYALVGLFEQGPMNDLDVFGTDDELPINVTGQADEAEKIRSIDPKTGCLTITTFSARIAHLKQSTLQRPTLKHNSFMCFLSDTLEKNGYAILDSYRDFSNPEINYINVAYPAQSDHPKGKKLTGVEKARALLDGFDINACEIALDMQTRQVVWSEAFQNFLYRPQLICTYLGTPMHTAVRLCKKQEELPFASIDLPVEMHKLQAASAALLRITTSRPNIPGSLMSNIYARRFERYQYTLAPYFTLRSEECFFEQGAMVEIFNGTDETSRRDLFQTTVKTSRTMFRMIPNQHDEFAVDSFLARWFSSNTLKFNVESTMRTFQVWLACAMQPTTKMLMQKLLPQLPAQDSLMDTTLLANFAMERFASVPHVSTKDIARMRDMFGEHTELLGLAISKYDCSITELSTIAKQLRWLEKNQMRYYIGWLETEQTPMWMQRAYRFEDLNLMSLLLDDFRQLSKAHHQTYMDGLKDQRAQPIWSAEHSTVAAAFPNARVAELSCAYSLFIEGQELRHCVGGYFEGVLRGNSVIFSICTSEDPMDTSQRSTLQLHKRTWLSSADRLAKPVWEQSQLFGIGNTKAPDVHYEIAKVLLDDICRITGLPSMASALASTALPMAADSTEDDLDIPF